MYGQIWQKYQLRTITLKILFAYEEQIWKSKSFIEQV